MILRKTPLCIGLGLLLMLGATPSQAQPRAPQDGALPATATSSASAAARVSQADQVRVLLLADRETTLSSPVTARIVSLNASMGLSFGAGQTLIAFECDEPVARLKMAQAELASAQETLDGRLRMQGLEQASEVEVALATAAVNKARGQIDLQQAQVAQCSIRAPWAGHVAKVHIRSHMSVTPGQPLLDLVKNGPLRMKLNLPSKLVARVAKGSRVNLVIDETGKTYEARIHAVNSRIDSVSQTVEVEAIIEDKHPELLPGMSGVADLATLR